MWGKLPRWGSTAFWVIFFMIALVGVNWVLFYSYQQSNPQITFWTQVWNYCGSDAFKAVTISLMIPIILAAMGGIFKIGVSVEERIRSALEKQTEKRLECIKRTSELWNELYRMAGDVRFGNKGVGSEQSIVAIIKQVENLASSAEEIVSTWRSRFPNLSAQDIASFVELLNILVDSSQSVVYYIQDSTNEKEIAELQDSLGVIQDAIKWLAHEKILSILNDSVELLGTDLSWKDKKEITARIKSYLANLNEWANAAKVENRQNNKLLPTIQGKEVDAFREAAGKLNGQLANPEKTPDYTDFYKQFHQIPLKDFPYAFEISYSKEYIVYLAHWLGYQYMCFYVQTMAKESA
jgi:hypothetical protein